MNMGKSLTPSAAIAQDSVSRHFLMYVWFMKTVPFFKLTSVFLRNDHLCPGNDILNQFCTARALSLAVNIIDHMLQIETRLNSCDISIYGSAWWLIFLFPHLLNAYQKCGKLSQFASDGSFNIDT